MADTNLSCVLYGVNDLRMEEFPMRCPGPEDVQIDVRSVGLCGSDVSYWQNGHIGSLVVNSPMVMGHEASGVVTQVGEAVSNLKTGDRVAIEPSKPCGRCEMCKTGHYNICDRLQYLATPPSHGCMQRSYCHPASFVHKLPDNVSFDEGALMQPLALGFYAAGRGGVRVGHYVLVSGAGPLGMSVVLATKACGAAKVLVTDIFQDRLDYIRKIGADLTLLVKKEETERELSKRCVDLLGRPPDVAIECSGNPSATANAIYSTKKRGVVVQVGFGSPDVSIPLVEATLKELDIRGMARFCNIYPTVIEAVSSGRVNVEQLVTHRFPLEKAVEAMAATRDREGVKVIVDCTRQKDDTR